MAEPIRAGYVALVGRPNTGKSTLLNYLVGQKLSITSRKPQTTRHQILGIRSETGWQAVYVDTPGMHKDGERAINRVMNRAARAVLSDVDAIVMVVDRTAWTDEDERVLEQVTAAGVPVILAANKVDLLADKRVLLPHLEALSQRADFAAIVPLSALREHNLDQLDAAVLELLPAREFFFPEDQVTDRTERFLAAEIVREKITRQLGDELPYATAVEIEEFAEDAVVLHISALILVERRGQKRIVIGEGGSRLRAIGTEARKDMERLFDQKVMLRLWVKVRAGWSDDERALKSLGYDERG
ncbi:GTPase Era [Pseudohaliea rubra]|uniref:GTPase Era n=1 Tax=Pseudohaliea rubra DSM 19751 TaxID=1265313 RepID=A0A095VV72_9GAMM|nr:GTPase Era [Pseudohaliea rubra]KGE05255.1 GTP-binding protein Era [Pseudohaliea rubra DSM 19751]